MSFTGQNILKLGSVLPVTWVVWVMAWWKWKCRTRSIIQPTRITRDIGRQSISMLNKRRVELVTFRSRSLSNPGSLFLAIIKSLTQTTKTMLFFTAVSLLDGVQLWRRITGSWWETPFLDQTITRSRDGFDLKQTLFSRILHPITISGRCTNQSKELTTTATTIVDITLLQKLKLERERRKKGRELSGSINKKWDKENRRKKDIRKSMRGSKRSRDFLNQRKII